MSEKPYHPKGKRILISGGLALGGTQTHIANLCRVLCDAGAEVAVASASCKWSDEAIADLRKLGVRICISPFGFGRFGILGKAFALLFWPFLLRHNYDVVYCIGEGWMHLWASRFAGNRGWRIYHEIVISPPPGSVGAKVAARMDVVVANSRDVARRMSKFLGDIPVRAIPFLTSSAPMDPPRDRFRLPGRELNITFLGRLAPHKSPDKLLEAWPAWMKQESLGPARLDIYGGDYDGLGANMLARISELGLQENVSLHGAYSIEDLPKIFESTDIVVLPSIYEGLPLVLVEAMQCGIPVVATSAGGTAELGDGNPDVIITEGIDWNKFATGLETMAKRVRAGEIDRIRLHAWTEARYGFDRVSEIWRQALLTPEIFFKDKPAFVPKVTSTMEQRCGV
jgi:glycosyltransferase involved in cell wall biosynthesis